MSRLLRPQDVPCAAQLEVLHADPEARPQVAHLLQGLESLARDVAQGLVPLDQQVAVGLLVPAAHAAAQLVQLRQAEVVGVLDQDRPRRRDVHAVLDDGRRHEDIGLAAGERLHHRPQLLGRHLAVSHGEGRAWHEPRQAAGHRVDG